jgi:serine/threonine-protein kinase
MADQRIPPRTADRLQRLLKAEEDDAKVWLALRRGLLSDEQINEALVELVASPEAASDEVPRRLRDIILARGWLKTSDLDALIEVERRSEFETRAREAKPPAEVEIAMGDPARRVAEFVLVEPLGHGGAAIVWRAWDLELRRWVAIKVPSWPVDSLERRERFRREAQAAARLTHPSIVPVHRVAEDQGRPYIVMQLVEGRTLAELRLPLDKAVRVMETVARAVGYAHEQGVLHRDLKPGNMMLDRQGRVWIFDFGLAHLFEDERKLTATGAVTGTASYMSPEQARGQPGARQASADIYSLGATLYELVTGRPPFEGDTFVEILDRVVRIDPVPPRRLVPRLPRDLDTIILKALEKDPGRRYRTAEDFAEDLRRYADGERIVARQAGRLGQIYRSIRKNPVIAFLSVVGSGAILAAGVLLIRGFEQSRQIDRERERTAIEKTVALRTMREMARLSLDAALKLRRSGDTEHMRDFLPVLESAYEKAAVRAELAEVDYLMGRMHRALLDDTRALAYQERALGRDPLYAPALYERIVLLSEKHSRDLRRAYDAEQERGKNQVSSPELIQLQETILRDCALLEKPTDPIQASDLPRITPANAVAARGILAYHQGRYDEARARLNEAVRLDPLIEEAWSALARAAVGQSRRAPDAASRERLWEEALAFYTDALEQDRGYLPHLLGRSELTLIRGKTIFSAGRDPDPDFAAAEEDLRRAIRLYGSRAEPWRRRGDVRTSRANLLVDRGQDPTSVLATAEADFHEALKREPTSAETWMRRGMAWMVSATYRINSGEDPLADLAAAEDHLGQANRIDPLNAEAWMRRGMIQYDRAVFQKEQGQDPFPELERSQEKLTRAAELNPGYSKTWIRRARALIQRSRWNLDQGMDPSADLDAAEKDLDRALRIDRSLEEAWMRKGILETVRASRRLTVAGDATPMLSAAKEHFDAALAIKKDYAEAWIERGHLFLLQGRSSEKTNKEDSRRHFQAALSDYSHALRLNASLERAIADSIKEARSKLGSE